MKGSRFKGHETQYTQENDKLVQVMMKREGAGRGPERGLKEEEDRMERTGNETASSTLTKLF